MVDFLSSKISVIETDPSITTLPQLPTAVPAFVGLTEFGPLSSPTEISSWTDYVDTFGSYASMSAAAGGARCQVPVSVRNFFLNGGRKCVVVRLLDESPTAAAVADITCTHTSGTTAVAALVIAAKNKGVWGNNLVATIAAASSGDASEYKLTLKKSGTVVETWDNLPKATANSVINSTTSGSAYITVTVSKGTVVPTKKDWTLAGGLDGGTPSDAVFTGAFALLDTKPDITLLSVPDSQSAAVQGAMITYCETTRNGLVFAVLDPGVSKTAANIVSDVGSLSASEHWAMYWPRLRIPNPDSSIYTTEGEFVVVPPSGFICGVMARNDAKYLAGPFVQPAGIDDGRIFGAVELESDNHAVLKESTRDLVYPEKVNPITFMSGYSIFIDGTKVGAVTGNFLSVGERRGASAVERNLKNGLQWARHKNNTEALRGKVERSVYGELLTWAANGALASRDPSEAFIVDADVPGVGINNARVRAQRRLYVQLGLATAQPTDFIIILVSQDMRAIQEATKGLMA